MSLNTILATAPLTTTNYVIKATGTALGNSIIYDNGTNVGIGNTNTSFTLDVSGTGRFTGIVTFGSTLSNGTYAYTLPSATGTLALVGGSGVGTVTSVAALTIGTTGTDLSSTVATSTTTPVITLNVPTASAANRGALASADWTTFNNKQGTITLTTTGTSGAATFSANTLNIPQYQGVLTNPVTGTGTTNYLPKFTGTSTIGNSLVYDDGTSVFINATSGGYTSPRLLINNGVGVSLGLCVIADGGGRISRFQTADYNNTNTGSTLRFGFGAASGNTSSEITAYSNGESLLNSLVLNGAVIIASTGNVSITDTASFGGQARLFSRITADATTVGKITDSSFHIWNTTNVGSLSQITFGYTNGSTTNASVYLGLITTNGVGSGYGDFVLGTAPSANVQCVERLRIASTGAATFSSSVECVKRAYVTGISTNAAYTTYTSTGANTAYFGVDNSAGNEFISGGSAYAVNLIGVNAYPMIFGTNNTERMRITSAGNVLIGATTTVGAAGTNIEVTGSRAQLVVNSTGSIASWFTVYPAGDGNTYILRNTGYSYLFGTATSQNTTGFVEQMRITSGGKVLVNTTTTTAENEMFTVRGEAAITYLTDVTRYRQLYYSGNDNFYFYNGSNNAYLSSAGAWTNASDITIKKEIEDLQYGLNEILSLKPRKYKMKSNDIIQIGFIAQEVEEILPELVDEDDKGMKGLSYGQMTAVLVKAIQEQQAQIQNLQEQINILAK